AGYSKVNMLQNDALLMVIASEGRYTVKQYFEVFRSLRIPVRVIETESGLFSPCAVLQRLDDDIREHDIGPGSAFCSP
ncbi:MAG: hypothetical protein AAF664_24370, partial [Planctomycetota bacterium]